jgi:hypothetical protein
MHDFGEQFKAALDDCLRNPDRPDSHVLESISGRGSLFEIFRRDETLRRLQALLKEIEWNDHVVERTEKAIQEKETLLPTARLRITATELLITNRYIDENDDVFSVAEDYYDICVATNERLEKWVEDDAGTRKWLLKQFNVDESEYASLKALSKEFLRKVTSAYEQIRSRT